MNCKMLLTIFIVFAFMNNLFAHKIAPTSHGSYSSGEKIVNKTIVFTGSGSHDNDSQDGGYIPKWEWSVSADGVIWGSSYMYTTSTFTYTFTTADTFYIRVRFCDNDNQWGAYYTFTIEIIDCKRYYYVKDHLGNIRQTVDENGNIISAQDYSPYGEVIRSYNNADANDKYKFTEKERDKETNLDYFGARFYDPSIGRWNSIDRFAAKYPGLSPYNYTACNPLRFIDVHGDSLNLKPALQTDGVLKTNYTRGLIADAESKTGLQFSIKNGKLEYAQDNKGNPIIQTDANGNQIGSQTARNEMIKLISDPSMVNLYLIPGSGSGGLGQDIGLDPYQINSFITGAQNGLNNTTQGWAMTFIHEWLHTTPGGSLSDGIQQGQVSFVENIIRSELGASYGQRTSYQSYNINGDNYIPFDQSALIWCTKGIPPSASMHIKY